VGREYVPQWGAASWSWGRSLSALGRVKKTENALQGSDDHRINIRVYRVSTSLVDVKNLIEERTEL